MSKIYGICLIPLFAVKNGPCIFQSSPIRDIGYFLPFFITKIKIGNRLIGPGVFMRIRGFLYGLVIPCSGLIIRPCLHIRQHIFRFCHPFQDAVDQRHGFGAGDGLIRTESAVGIAADPAEMFRQRNKPVCSVIFIHIAEAGFAVIDRFTEPDGDGGEFGAADRCIGT